MSRSWRGKKDEEDAERLLQEAFGVSEDQLLQDFILAQTEVKDSDIPPEPEDGFERLMAKLEAEVGASPDSENTSSSEDNNNIVKLHEEARKPRRLKTIVKVSVAAAAIAVMVVAMGISAGAKREYRYVVRERDSVRSDIVLNNVDAIPTEDELDRVYSEIMEKSQVQPIRFAYMPEKMKYTKMYMGKTGVVMYFKYGENRIKVIQQFQNVGSSMGIVSDRKKIKSVYNDFLGQTLNLEKAKNEDGKIEYSSRFIKGNTYYQISGIMPKKEFENVIKNIYLEKY